MCNESVAAGTLNVLMVSFLTKFTISVYFVMTPLRRRGSGGCHWIRTEVEDNASSITFVGLPVGAVCVERSWLCLLTMVITVSKCEYLLVAFLEWQSDWLHSDPLYSQDTQQNCRHGTPPDAQ